MEKTSFPQIFSLPFHITARATMIQQQNNWFNLAKTYATDYQIKTQQIQFKKDPIALSLNSYKDFKHLQFPQLAKFLEIDRNEIPRGIQSIQCEANNPIEDRIVVKWLNNKEGIMMAVFDGHGGHALAEQCASNIHKQFQSAYQYFSKQSIEGKQVISKSLAQAFNRLQQSFINKAKQETRNNKRYKKIGSCAICCILTRQYIIVANAGDSKAILVSTQTGETIQLSQMFNTHNEKQQQRLLAQFPKENILITNPKNEAKYIKGCLIPTRCLGDLHLKKAEFAKGYIDFNGPYITHEPDIQIHQLNSQMKYHLVIGSDGLWDELNDDEISKTLADTEYLNKAQALKDAALDRVAEKNQISIEKIQQLSPKVKRDYHDDISIIVADLQKILI